MIKCKSASGIKSLIRAGAASLLLAVSLPLALAQDTTTVTVPLQNANYSELFQEFDNSINNGEAYSDHDNTTAVLGWAQSYMMLSYMQMYHATSNTVWLDKIETQFNRVLEKRDDRLGRADIYAGKPLKGWGGERYDEGRWHVYVVHTGQICKAPADFIRVVKSDPALTEKYGATADRWLGELEEIVADANRDFVTSGTVGYYVDGSMEGGKGGKTPLNMTTAMGSVVAELYDITKKPEHKEHATKIANLFRQSLQERDGTWVWEYAIKPPGTPFKTGEDISHAAINVDFAVRCYQAGIVFTKEDMDRFAKTWLKNVDKGDRFADYVDGTENPRVSYIPQAAGRWLCLVDVVSEEFRQPLIKSAKKAFSGKEIEFPSKGVGLSRLARYTR